jgi:hypothetical protein
LNKKPALIDLDQDQQGQSESNPIKESPEAFSKATSGAKKFFALDLRVKESSRYFSGSVLSKAFGSLDKSMGLIIGISWFVALAVTGIAIISVRDATSLKIKVETARALDPIIPKIDRISLLKEQYEPLVKRIKKQFPTILFEITSTPSLLIKSNQGDDFVTWLNAVSYADSLVPSIRWTLTRFCVGVECAGDFMMTADIKAESINIVKVDPPAR